MRVVVVASLLVALTGCASAAGTDRNTHAGTLSGVVLSAPSCPVEQAGSPCPPQPVSGAAVTAADTTGSVVARTRTDAHGRFTMRLDAGDYTIVARMVGGIGTSASARVSVGSGEVATVTLTVDSGIR